MKRFSSYQRKSVLEHLFNRKIRTYNLKCLKIEFNRFIKVVMMRLVDIRKDTDKMIQEVLCSSVFLISPIMCICNLIFCTFQTGSFSYFLYARNSSTLELSISSLHWYGYLFISVCSEHQSEETPGFVMPTIPSLKSV